MTRLLERQGLSKSRGKVTFSGNFPALHFHPPHGGKSARPGGLPTLIGPIVIENIDSMEFQVFWRAGLRRGRQQRKGEPVPVRHRKTLPGLPAPGSDRGSATPITGSADRAPDSPRPVGLDGMSHRPNKRNRPQNRTLFQSPIS